MSLILLHIEFLTTDFVAADIWVFIPKVLILPSDMLDVKSL